MLHGQSHPDDTDPPDEVWDEISPAELWEEEEDEDFDPDRDEESGGYYDVDRDEWIEPEMDEGEWAIGMIVRWTEDSHKNTFCLMAGSCHANSNGFLLRDSSRAAADPIRLQHLP